MIRVSKTLEKIATDTSSHIEGLSQHVNQLRRLLENSRGRTVVITGAGISTDSGIPDYRGPNGVYVRNKDFKPIQYQQVCMIVSVAPQVNLHLSAVCSTTYVSTAILGS